MFVTRLKRRVAAQAVRIRRPRLAALAVAACFALCCACSAGTGPDAQAAPTVGRPAQPASMAVALARQPLLDYAEVGITAADPLAPDEDESYLVAACMNRAGFPDVTGAGLEAFDPAPVASTSAGVWGFLGLTRAQQYGFAAPPGSAAAGPRPHYNAAELTASRACEQHAQSFITGDNTLLGATLMGAAGQETVSNAQFKAAVATWTRCMTAAGRQTTDPLQYAQDALATTAASPGSAAFRTQIGEAIDDARCTDSSDLAGVYFALTDAYQLQLLTRDHAALDTAVGRYRHDFQHEMAVITAK